MSDYITGHAHRSIGAKYGAPTVEHMAAALEFRAMSSTDGASSGQAWVDCSCSHAHIVKKSAETAVLSVSSGTRIKGTGSEIYSGSYLCTGADGNRRRRLCLQRMV